MEGFVFWVPCCPALFVGGFAVPLGPDCWGCGFCCGWVRLSFWVGDGLGLGAGVGVGATSGCCCAATWTVLLLEIFEVNDSVSGWGAKFCLTFVNSILTSFTGIKSCSEDSWVELGFTLSVITLVNSSGKQKEYWEKIEFTPMDFCLEKDFKEKFLNWSGLHRFITEFEFKYSPSQVVHEIFNWLINLIDIKSLALSSIPLTSFKGWKKLIPKKKFV